jgi:hypothetical protein
MFVLISLRIHFQFCKITRGSADKDQTDNSHKEAEGDLDIPPRERNFNQDYPLAFGAPESANENARAKRRLDTEHLDVCMDNSICHHGGKI